MPRPWTALLIVMLLMAIPACDWDPAIEMRHPPRQIGLLEDTGGRMDINQAASPLLAPRYQIRPGHRMSLGFRRSALWVRIALDQAPATGPWVLEVAAPWMDRVDLYLPKPGGGWSGQSTGLDQPLAANRVSGFALEAPADTPRTGYAYLRLQSVLSLNAGLRLWTHAGFFSHVVTDSYLFGTLYGVLGAMVLVNLMVLLTTRDRAYLLYVLYLLSITAHQICLQGQVLLLPTSVWHLVPELSLVVSASLFFFGAAFCRVFIVTKEHAPLVDRLLQGVQAAALLLLALGLSGQLWWGTWVVHSLALVGPVLAIVAGIKALAHGFRPARFYLVAWVVLLLGAMAWGAWSMGWQVLVPLPRSLITVAAALECVLLSLALADRIGVMQRERRLLAQRERRFRHMSITDDLTGLFNARYLWSKLASEIRHAHELGQPLGLVLLDVDGFKRFNDTYGHIEGDRVLAALGRLMREVVRPADSPCRYGGEEFALVLPGAEGQASREVAERLRETLARLSFRPGDGERVTVTVSLGTAQLLPGDDAGTLVKRADRALYEAKARGKNQTVSSEE